MDITEANIQAFSKCWQVAFGEAISPEQARRELRMLDELFAMLASHELRGKVDQKSTHE